MESKLKSGLIAITDTLIRIVALCLSVIGGIMIVYIVEYHTIVIIVFIAALLLYVDISDRYDKRRKQEKHWADLKKSRKQA